MRKIICDDGTEEILTVKTLRKDIEQGDLKFIDNAESSEDKSNSEQES